MFYLGATFLGLIAALFTCWPLLRKRVANSAESLQHDQVVRAVFRQRLAELEGETQDPDLRQEIENELGAVLLSEEQAAADTTAGDYGKATSVWLIALLIPICGALLYWQVADPTLQNIRGAEEVLTVAADDTVVLESWVRRLAERTDTVDDDSKSWYLLGHAYLKLRRFAEAAEAFATTSKRT
jgi:cytochrome c-type biogenesis protein CcmH